MANGYWISCYRAVKDPARLAAYGKLAGPAIEKHGGRFLVRGPAAHVYEAGVKERTVIAVFESVAAAIACHDSADYHEALKVLGKGAVERDFRIVEGVA
jgi:uncharacterized protein (DUF1330 family)